MSLYLEKGSIVPQQGYAHIMPTNNSALTQWAYDVYYVYALCVLCS